MAVSPFASASFGARPGYTPGPAMQHVSPPALQVPAMPSLPALPQHATAPNAVAREWLGQQLSNLPGLYNPMLTDARGKAQEQLAGYGGWRWQADNPATPEREDLAVPVKDPNAALGERERQAVQAQRYAANAAGMLDSSFANKAVGAALGALNEEAKGIVRQYSVDINSINRAQQQASTDIITDLVRLYGEDARWLAENPPPRPPETPPAPAAPAPAPGSSAGAPADGGPAPMWDQNPGFSPAQVRAGWGPNAELVQAGNGKWVIRDKVAEARVTGQPNHAALSAAPAGGGNLALWNQKPKGLTPAKVRERWGPNAELVQAGNGKWVIRDRVNKGRL